MRRRIPTLSLCALLVAGVFVFGSTPLWRLYLDHQVASALHEGYAADPGRMAGFALLFGEWLAGTLGAMVGVVLSVAAHVRREPLVWLRVFTLVENIALLGVGLFVLVPLGHHP